jgi:hypothetical protein
MIRSVKIRLRWLPALLSGGAFLLGLQKTPPADDSGRDREVQSVYSWFLNHSTGTDEIFLIAPTTVPAVYPDDSCLSVPADHASDFRQVRADFERHNNIQTRIPAPLSSGKRYILFTTELTQELMKSPLLSRSPIVQEKFGGARHLWLFSNVSFNRTKTLALFQVDAWCGGLCGEFYWIVLEKDANGAWQSRPWARGCRAVA